MDMKNAIIILNYNDSDHTISLVDHIKNYTSIHEIIVVDNCSTDDSCECLLRLKERIPKIHLLRTEYNGGYAYGNNYGCKYAIDILGVDCLTISNPDVSFDEELMEKMLHYLDLLKNVGCISSHRHTEKNGQKQVAWRLPTYRDCLLESTIIARKCSVKTLYYSEQYLQGEEVVPVDVVAGAFFLMSAETYKLCDGFDERTFLYYEENILAWKMKKNQLQSYIVNGEYSHVSSTSVDKEMKNLAQRFRIAQDSREIYLRYYMGCRRLEILFCRLASVIGSYTFCFAKKINGMKIG